MPIGLGTKVAAGGMAGAGLAGILAPEFLFGISYLEGDPATIRKAADVLDEVADTIDEHFRTANSAATAVWTTSSGPAVEEFKKFWTERYGPAVLEVSLRHRRAANACRAYADVIEQINHALKVLCWIMTVDMMFTIGYQVLTWKLFQAIKKRQALLLKITANRFVMMLLPMFTYWVADSTAYATGEVVLPLAINKLGGIKTDTSGNDVQSLGYNLKTFREHFVANMVFNGVVDGSGALMAKVPGLRTVATDVAVPNEMIDRGAEMMAKVPGLRDLVANVQLPRDVTLNTASALPRLTASTAYSMTMDAQHGDNPLPGTEHGLTKEDMYQKFIVHGTRSLIPKMGGVTGKAASPP